MGRIKGGVKLTREIFGMIKIGDSIPSVTLFVLGDDGGPEAVTTDELFADKVVAFFGLPGAFTPTCSAQHLPGYIENTDALLERAPTKLFACRSTMPSSWPPGARTRAPRAR